jgi:hypothetical protein
MRQRVDRPDVNLCRYFRHPLTFLTTTNEDLAVDQEPLERS